METKAKNEIVGRLWLWRESVEKTKHLLEMSFRAIEAKHNEVRLLEDKTYVKKLNEFAEQQPGYQKGHILTSHRQKFNEIHYREFPTWLECCAIQDAFVELAIVYFCQIFNLGKSQVGETAKSDQKFRDVHLEEILKITFQTNEDLSKFNVLREQVLNSRDKVIGHSDGDAFSIMHNSPVSIKRGPNISWRVIDFEFWYSFLERMINAIQNYSNRLQIQPS